jgi:hypothetical protein
MARDANPDEWLLAGKIVFHDVKYPHTSCQLPIFLE